MLLLPCAISASGRMPARRWLSAQRSSLTCAAQQGVRGARRRALSKAGQ
jgi:hypothetical protein